MAFLGLSTPMCLGCVLGLVLGPLGASGGPLAAIVVRLGVVLLVLGLVVVIAVLVLLRVAGLLFLLSLGQALRVRKLMCMQMRLVRLANRRSSLQWRNTYRVPSERFRLPRIVFAHPRSVSDSREATTAPRPQMDNERRKMESRGAGGG